MAEVCAGCGRAGYLQAQVRTHECLACGAITEDATGQVLPQVQTPPKVSNHGYPVRELSSSTAGDVGPGEDRRVRPVGEQPAVVGATSVPLPARADAAGVAYWQRVSAGEEVAVEEPTVEEVPDLMGPGDAEQESEIVDLSQLTPEQAEAIERILGETA